MRAVLMVITNVLEEKSLQMPFVRRNNMIQQLPPTAFDPALRHPVSAMDSRTRFASLQSREIARQREPPLRTSGPGRRSETGEPNQTERPPAIAARPIGSSD